MRRAAALLLAGAALAAGCGEDGGPAATSEATSAATAATAAATSAPTDEPAPAGVALEPVVDGLDRPVAAVAVPGDDRILVVEQHAARILVVRDGRIEPSPFLDLGGQVATGNEQGLLGLALAPDFASSGHLVVNLTDVEGTTRIVRYTAVGDAVDPASAVELLRVEQPYENHNGGHVAFGPDGLLWVGLGDGGAAGDPEGRAQDPGVLLGKLLRLDTEAPGAAPEVWALGLRNPWRYAFDPPTGDLWIGDVGQDDVEEVDRIASDAPAGANFGWDLFEGTRPFSDGAAEPARYVPPITEYPHDDGCSVTGGLVVRDPAVPALEGRYLFGDFCSGRLWTVAADAGPGTAAEEWTDRLGGPLQGLASFGTDGDGHVLLVVQDGRILRLVASP